MSKFYGTVQKSAKGRFAIKIPIDYELWGSGVLLPPIIDVQLWGLQNVPFYLVTDNAQLGKQFDVSQQHITRLLKTGGELQQKISAGEYLEADIWGYSPTQERRIKYGLVTEATPKPESVQEKK